MEKQPLAQQENIKKFSQLLNENGMSDQKRNLIILYNILIRWSISLIQY